MAAVSDFSIVSPILTILAPESLDNLISFTENPPTGPMNTDRVEFLYKSKLTSFNASDSS